MLIVKLGDKFVEEIKVDKLHDKNLRQHDIAKVDEVGNIDYF